VSEIDPQAVFISDAGEVRYLPQHAGEDRVIEFRPPPARLGEPVHFDDIRQYDVPFTALSTRSSRTQKAICRLLQERDAEAALVDKSYEMLYRLETQPLRPWSPEEMELVQTLRERHWRNKERAR
jgi:hypothetical protein